MKITKEMSLSNFEFWSGGADRAKMLTNEELDKVGEILEYNFPEGFDATCLNDLFWFDFGYVCELLHYVYNEDGEIIRNPTDDDWDKQCDCYCYINNREE